MPTKFDLVSRLACGLIADLGTNIGYSSGFNQKPCHYMSYHFVRNFSRFDLAANDELVVSEKG